MGTTLPLETIEPPTQGIEVVGGRPNVNAKLPTKVAPSKNCTLPASLGAPVGAQALTRALIRTSPETALTLAPTVVVVMSVQRGATVKVSAFEALGQSVASPLYIA